MEEEEEEGEKSLGTCLGVWLSSSHPADLRRRKSRLFIVPKLMLQRVDLAQSLFLFVVGEKKTYAKMLPIPKRGGKKR